MSERANVLAYFLSWRLIQGRMFETPNGFRFRVGLPNRLGKELKGRVNKNGS